MFVRPFTFLKLVRREANVDVTGKLITRLFNNVKDLNNTSKVADKIIIKHVTNSSSRVSTETSALTNRNNATTSVQEKNSDGKIYQLENLNINRSIKYNESNSEVLEDKYVPDLARPLDTCTEDLSDVGPYTTHTFNLAKYADQSQALKELIKLGVNLYKIEPIDGIKEAYLKLDFEKDVKPYILFLHNCGVPADMFGHIITKFPQIFMTDMDDLHTRIRYLRAHQFTADMVKTIICGNPYWLSFSTKAIDGRLGYFQHNFKLKGYEVRCLALQSPKIITYPMKRLHENTFAVREEMGFSVPESKVLLTKAPGIWRHSRFRIVDTFEYAHKEMQLSHASIAKQPSILQCRKNRLENRHTFLVKLNKAQYDPTLPLYVSPFSVAVGSDADFCKVVAKVNLETYNLFLRTV